MQITVMSFNATMHSLKCERGNKNKQDHLGTQRHHMVEEHAYVGKSVYEMEGEVPCKLSCPTIGDVEGKCDLRNDGGADFLEILRAPLLQELQDRSGCTANTDVRHEGQIFHQATRLPFRGFCWAYDSPLHQYHASVPVFISSVQFSTLTQKNGVIRNMTPSQ